MPDRRSDINKEDETVFGGQTVPTEADLDVISSSSKDISTNGQRGASGIPPSEKPTVRPAPPPPPKK